MQYPFWSPGSHLVRSNRGRLKDFVAREVKDQLKSIGVATQADVDGLKRRVRELERAAGMTASGRSRTAAKKPAAKAASAKRKSSKG